MKKKLFAIKTVNMDCLSDIELSDALQEAKIMPTLNHPNIINFEDCFVMKQPKLALCIVMEYADGEDLKKRIQSQRKLKKFFSENQILDWFTQICLGVKHLHDRKILHRDLKSENIFLTRNNIIKLGDFGVCKCLDYTLQKATTEIGTPYYISPEIILGDSYSYPTDIWSLGVILYELCALKLPFEGRNRPELNANIIRGKFSEINSGYSNDLKMLLRNLLNVKEERRLRVHDILSNINY
jgi:NIMA (never in mitosis gene a)-related kinase